MQTQSTQNVVHQLRLTEMETRESIIEHLKDVSEGRLWRAQGYKSLQHYCEAELGYSRSETRELLSQIGEIVTTEQLRSSDPQVQIKIDILKEWRKRKAFAMEIQAYRVISNRTLLQLAERSPKSADDLLNIFGIGEKKRDEFGTEILSLLN